jgi:hypothetical protein
MLHLCTSGLIHSLGALPFGPPASEALFCLLAYAQELFAKYVDGNHLVTALEAEREFVMTPKMFMHNINRTCLANVRWRAAPCMHLLLSASWLPCNLRVAQECCGVAPLKRLRLINTAPSPRSLHACTAHGHENSPSVGSSL